jgi:hypothetical protein
MQGGSELFPPRALFSQVMNGRDEHAHSWSSPIGLGITSRGYAPDLRRSHEGDDIACTGQKVFQLVTASHYEARVGNSGSRRRNRLSHARFGESLRSFPLA